MGRCDVEMADPCNRQDLLAGFYIETLEHRIELMVAAAGSCCCCCCCIVEEDS